MQMHISMVKKFGRAVLLFGHWITFFVDSRWLNWFFFLFTLFPLFVMSTGFYDKCISGDPFLLHSYRVLIGIPYAGRDLINLDRCLRWNQLFSHHVYKLKQQKPVIICDDMNVGWLKSIVLYILKNTFTGRARARRIIINNSWISDMMMRFNVNI